jgi:hypothetical protein
MGVKMDSVGSSPPGHARIWGYTVVHDDRSMIRYRSADPVGIVTDKKCFAFFLAPGQMTCRTMIGPIESPDLHFLIGVWGDFLCQR